MLGWSSPLLVLALLSLLATSTAVILQGSDADLYRGLVSRRFLTTLPSSNVGSPLERTPTATYAPESGDTALLGVQIPYPFCYRSEADHYFRPQRQCQYPSIQPKGVPLGVTYQRACCLDDPGLGDTNTCYLWDINKEGVNCTVSSIPQPLVASCCVYPVPQSPPPPRPPPPLPPTPVAAPAGGSVGQHYLGSYQRSILAVLLSQFSRKAFRGGMSGVHRLAQTSEPVQKLLLEGAGLTLGDIQRLERWGPSHNQRIAAFTSAVRHNGRDHEDRRPGSKHGSSKPRRSENPLKMQSSGDASHAADRNLSTEIPTWRQLSSGSPSVCAQLTISRVHEALEEQGEAQSGEEDEQHNKLWTPVD